MKGIVLLTGLFILSGSLYAQVNKKLDSLLNILSANNQFMGSLTITRNGHVIYSKISGYEQLNDHGQTPATEHSKYRIGSISKLFTATIIFQLIDENKLTLNTKLDQFFPSVPNAKLITIGNLLNHHGGLSDLKSIPDFTSWTQSPKSEEDILKVISQSTVEFSPGTKAAYSNSGFILLSYIIERVCHQPYAQVLQVRICKKIGLSETYYSEKRNTRPHESYSYEFQEGWKPVAETDWSIPTGAGGILSTTADMAKFITCLFSGKLISPKSLDQMKTITDNYGMDLVEMRFDDHLALGHTGRMDGYWSTLAYFPENGVAIAYSANGQRYAMDDVLNGVLNIYFNKIYALPSF
ncbi:CubicO group peptidase (beta-lactamase class C family) [Chitinophaga niastensis]|uniref:CubicO group peptidase (Beta-lactamase class C family) n=1 Tax=Chitinophaga niastensis TaxID=536980 RepID=A0A2P8HDK4_CHINA|nr:serine hydrolase domain-containing protein [Chitinophaga niastensis]PSL44314.1 CubicO group peptidase (beta-lactamase class C family) [Chitinophaga niastensis]